MVELRPVHFEEAVEHVADRDEAPAVIVAVGVPRQEALGTVRLTLDRGTTRDAVERAATALAKS